MTAELVVVWSPLCMEPDEWEDWQRLNPRLSYASGNADRPCADCPVGYARQMRAIRRCNGTPGLIEEEDPVIDRDDLTTIDVVSAAPCLLCAHRNVCSLRATVEGLDQLDVVLPKLPKVIKPIVSIRIECGEFLKDRSTGRGAFATDHVKREVSEETRAKLAASNSAYWTPERRAAQAERLRIRREAAAG